MRHGATRGQRFPHKEALPVSAVCFLCKGISTIAIRYGRSPRAVPNTIKDKSMKWFRKEKEAGRLFYSTDLHSHILPGIDDGSPDIDTSIQLLRAMQSWGIKHIFATPHIIDDVYENSPATIEPACQVLKAKMTQEGIDMEVRYSAEYRMDEHFRELRQSGTTALIPLPGQRLLVENSFLQAPIDLDEIRSAPLSYGTAVSDDTGRTFYDVASGIIFQRNGQLDSARYYIERTLSRTAEFHQGNVDLYNGAAQIYHETGDNARAYDFAQKYIEAKDSLFEVQRGTQVAELERRFRTANEAALREASLRYRAWIAVLVAALVITVAVCAVVWYRRKLRRRDEQLNESLALLDSYRESHDSLTSRLDASNAREAAVKRILEGRVAAVRDIAATCYTYGDGERLTAKMRELALSPAMLKDVVDMADLYSDRAVTRLEAQFPDWTQRNYDFAALVIAGFSPQEICVMLGMSLNGVYTLKSKLKRRIAESQAADRDPLLGFFA